MGIMTRFTRLCKADIHGVLDQMEDKGLLLTQCLREMETALGRKEARLKKMIHSRDQARREQATRSHEQEKVEQDLAVAIEKDRDDIARFLIKKLKPLVQYRDELDAHINTLDQEIIQFQAGVDEQRRQYEQFQLRAKEYFHKTERQQWDQALATIIPCGADREPSEEEVELELLRRKEAVKGGARP